MDQTGLDGFRRYKCFTVDSSDNRRAGEGERERNIGDEKKND